jgi:hypothetical protein
MGSESFSLIKNDSDLINQLWRPNGGSLGLMSCCYTLLFTAITTATSMAGPVIYSTNPRFAHDVAMKYRGGNHFVWCSEYYDPTTAPAGSVASAIAPSSSPKGIFDTLKAECDLEENHSALIKNFRKTFRRLATEWLADGSITKSHYDEIIATVKAPSWLIWRPQLYIIPVHPIVAAGRLISVSRKERAGYGPELRIEDLKPEEFDIIGG